jgi:hypothetical protein
MKRLLQVSDWFLYGFGLAGLAAMTTLAVIMPPGWPIITALLLAPPIITAVLLLLTPLVVGLLIRIAVGVWRWGQTPISANRRK